MSATIPLLRAIRLGATARGATAMWAAVLGLFLLVIPCSAVPAAASTTIGERGASAAPNIVDARYLTVAQWAAADGRVVVLRLGEYRPANGTGWGWRKIRGKHALAIDKVQFAVQHPFSIQKQGADTRNYFTYADHITCVSMGCRPVERVIIQVTVNFKTKGVITAYCWRYTVCPGWVNKATP